MERGRIARRDASGQHAIAARPHRGLAARRSRFEAGETIWTESSYKYRPSEIVAMLGRAGFREIDQWIDAPARSR